MQCHASSSATKLLVSPAPEPEDVLWDSLAVDYKSHLVRNILVYLFLFALIFFWSIPVGFISALCNLSNLSKIKFLGDILKEVVGINPMIKGFLEGFLPSLALIVFMALLVPIIKLAIWLRGLESYSKWDKGVFHTYFLFQVKSDLCALAIMCFWTCFH